MFSFLVDMTLIGYNLYRIKRWITRAFTTVRAYKPTKNILLFINTNEFDNVFSQGRVSFLCYIKMTETFNTHFLALNKEPFKNINFFS